MFVIQQGDRGKGYGFCHDQVHFAREAIWLYKSDKTPLLNKTNCEKMNRT